jgi:dipeptidase E
MEDGMKLLLTSVGATNDSIRGALVELLGKPVEDCRAVQINTALYASPNGPEDAYEMAKYYGEMGWKELGTLELTALPTIEEEHWLPFVQSSDAILVSGGNTGYLSFWMQESGFAEKLPGLLAAAVYFGISAGSTMLTPGQNYDPERLENEGIYYDDEFEEPAPRGAGSAWGMGLVDFSIRPHLGADYFPVVVDMAMMERAAARLDHPMYAIDDETAIKVVDGAVEVVSEGEWRYFAG